jgi:hypothetical protein
MQAAEEFDVSPLVDGRRIFVPGGELPPGAVVVEERNLARYTPPGAVQLPHGVPPIAIIGLPDGRIIDELFDDQTDSLRTLGFRFPWNSRAYALTCGARLMAVMRNIQGVELRNGQWAVVKWDDTRDWQAIFGRVCRASTLSLVLTAPNGDEHRVEFEHISFVSKILCWWDESGPSVQDVPEIS